MCLPYHQQLDQREASTSTPTVRTTPGRSTVCGSLDLLFQWGENGTYAPQSLSACVSDRACCVCDPGVCQRLDSDLLVWDTHSRGAGGIDGREIQVTASSGSVCPNCGSPVTTGARRCGSCGEAVDHGDR